MKLSYFEAYMNYYRDNRETLLMIIVWFNFEYRPSLVRTNQECGLTRSAY